MALVTIVRGGITLERDRLGNVTLHARGDGSSRIAGADMPDLMAAIAELLSVDSDGRSSPMSIEREPDASAPQ